MSKKICRHAYYSMEGNVVASQPAEYTTVNPHEAVAQLTRADWLRLEQLARYYVYRFDGINPREVVNEAVVRVLNGDRNCRPGLEFLQFLRGAIRSIADELRTREKDAIRSATTSTGLNELGFPEFADPSASPEAQVRDRQLVQRIWALFADDQSARALLVGAEEGMTALEVQRKFNMTPNEYGAARKRLERTIAKYLKDNTL